MPNDVPHVPTVGYLAVSEALLGHPTTGEPVVIVTLRPNPPSFSVVNLALPIDQAWRLATDLQSHLVPLVLLLMATVAGCGARLDLESANWDSSSGETARLAVEVDLLRTQRPERVGEAKATEPQPKPVAVEEKSATASSNTTIIVNIRGGDVTNHVETHIHVHEPPAPRIEERIVVHRDVEAEPPRRVDKHCEQMAREHEQRVEMWKRFPFGQ